MLPNLSHVLGEWTQPIKLIKTTRTRDDNFNQIIDTETTGIYAVVQPANKERLRADTIDWSLEYIQIHTQENTPLEIGNFIEYKNKSYKLVEVADYSDYGYFEAIAEQAKGDIR